MASQWQVQHLGRVQRWLSPNHTKWIERGRMMLEKILKEIENGITQSGLKVYKLPDSRNNGTHLRITQSGLKERIGCQQHSRENKEEESHKVD